MQIELHPQLYKDLSQFVSSSGKSVEEMVREASIRYLEDLEDEEACRDYLARKARGEKIETISMEELAKKCGIDLNNLDQYDGLED